MTGAIDPRWAEAIDRHLEQMIAQQRAKLLRMARMRRPNLTPEDLLMAHDYPELLHWPEYQYEDGILAGLIAAQVSLRAAFRGSA